MNSVSLPSDYQTFIALSRYARWLPEENRREEWSETVDRYLNNMGKHLKEKYNYDLTLEMHDSLFSHITGLDIMPSMRALMTSGIALDRCHVAGYNCSYVPVDSPRSFDETMYILMCGTGVGFSVERANVDKLPIINEHFEDSETVIKVGDSRQGWAKALRELIAMLYAGQVPKWDVSEVRPAGARLKTFGGRASGPAPLVELFEFCIEMFKGGAGRRLYPIECHDIMCKIGEVVVVGGVRRSALISLSNLGDDQMRHAKSGQWWENILRPYQFCNLSEVVVRENDDLEILKHKVTMATILGTFQSTLTDFKYLRKVWKDNTEEERLLGVSLTGIMDNELLNGGSDDLDYILTILKETAIAVNKNYAEQIGIPQSTAITCVKPSGTVSQLVDSASGIHARHSNYYIRTVRGDNKDPLTEFMIASGIPSEPDVMKPESTTVFSFPMKSPEGAITRNEMSALEQLELWLQYQRHWCEHKPSVTITVREEEWMEVGAWVYKHFDEVSGISFLPHSDHSYAQAPYQDITEKEYQKLQEQMPSTIDWSLLQNYEKEDTTTGSKELACSAGVCEVVDIQAS